MDTPTIKNKWIELYFGLFGPCLTYHTSGYDDDNARLVISLIFCQIYFTLPWKHHSRHESIHDLYATYGFYSASEPARMIFIWGAKHKMMLMPWSKVIVERELLNIHGNPVVCTLDDVATYDVMLEEVMALPSNYFHEAEGYGKNFKYFLARIKTCPRIFRKFKLFGKVSYETYVDLENDFNGYTKFMFNTNNNICVDKQIELQLMIRSEFYTDF